MSSSPDFTPLLPRAVQDANARGLLYEVGGDGKVRAIRAGGPSIQYVEGCA